MKKTCKLVSFLLTLALLCAMLSVGAAAATENTPFNDMTDSDWYTEYVEFTFKHGLMKGMSETTFEPKTRLSRAMLVTVLYRMTGSPAAAASGFQDVPAGEWYAAAVGWAAANGIVQGVGDNRFAPNLDITREETATILYRYTAHMNYDQPMAAVDWGSVLDNYEDAVEISDWALSALEWAVEVDLMTGYDGNLDPKDPCTRSEVATLLTRYVHYIIPQGEFSSEYMEVMEAYAQTLRAIRNSSARFDLVFINSDNIPELAVAPGGSHLSQVTVYTYYNGKVVMLGDDYGMYGTLPYAPWRNAFGNYSAPEKIFMGTAVSTVLNTDDFVELDYGHMYKINEKNIETYLLGTID